MLAAVAQFSALLKAQQHRHMAVVHRDMAAWRQDRNTATWASPLQLTPTEQAALCLQTEIQRNICVDHLASLQPSSIALVTQVGPPSPRILFDHRAEYMGGPYYTDYVEDPAASPETLFCWWLVKNRERRWF